MTSEHRTTELKAVETYKEREPKGFVPSIPFKQEIQERLEAWAEQDDMFQSVDLTDVRWASRHLFRYMNEVDGYIRKAYVALSHHDELVEFLEFLVKDTRLAQQSASSFLDDDEAAIEELNNAITMYRKKATALLGKAKGDE